jgi:hypothetical protein
MSGRLRTRIRLFIQKALESGVVIAGGERLARWQVLAGTSRGGESAKTPGLGRDYGLKPRLQAENEAVTAIRGMRVIGKRQSY